MKNRLLSLLLMLILCNSVLAQNRIALVIGNSAYGKEIGNLENPKHDARDIATALTALGFSVTQKLDADKRQMKQAISQFGKQLVQPDSVGLFYFAGHGVQVKNRNYLIPIGATIDGETDVEYEAIDAGRVLGKMEAAGNNLNLVILDACRDNPFGGSFRASYSRGLTRIPVPKGSMILYAASPGEKAADGQGRNGVFTQNLLQKLNQPGLTVDQVFKQTAEAVYNATGEKQLPYREGSIIGEFYFTNLTQNVPNPIVHGASVEDIFIQYMDKDDQIQIQTYLDEYPQGKLAVLFRAKLKKFDMAEDTLEASQPKQGQTWTDPGTDIEFVYIPAGHFQMGSPSNEDGRYHGEQKHRVSIDQGFWMSKYEITNAQFRKMKPNHNSQAYKGYSLNGPQQPAVSISWGDATDYAEWLSHRTGQNFTLPTEAEWEYAARGGGTESRYWGERADWACQYANVADKSAKHQWDGWTIHNCQDGYVVTSPVGKFKPNGFGLHDMLGNVWEWTCSTYSESYDGTEKVCSSASSTDKHVNRGGSWSSLPRYVRSANRHRYLQESRNEFLGFRLVRVHP